MDTFIFNCVFMMIAFVVIVLAIILLSQMQSLRARVTRLEALLNSGAVPTTAEPPRPVATPQTAAPAPVPMVPPPVPLGSGTTPVDKLVNWIREDWLLKLGAFLLLVAFGWLTTYAFLNNWIGPMGRIVLGLVAGTLFIILGWWRIQKLIHQGGVFLVLGSTTILLTVWAAREVYDFFTPLSALVMMFLSTAFVALASVKYNSRTLALSSIILAGVAPVLTAAPRTDDVGLFSYLLVVTLGTVWVIFLTGRRELTVAALALITIYSIPVFERSPYSDQSHLLMFAFAFAAIFFITNSIGIIKAKEKKSVADLITAAGNGLFLLTWIMTCAPDEWKSLIICAWMVAFVFGAFLLSRATGRLDPFYVYAGVGIAMIAAATSAELHGTSLTIAYTVECAIISVVTYFIRRDIRLAQLLSLLLIGPIMLSVESMFAYEWVYGVFNKNFFVLAILTVTLFGLGFFYRELIMKKGEKGLANFSSILIIAGSIYAYITLWLALGSAYGNPDNAVMTFLFILTVIGLVAYLFGRAKERKIYTVYGGLLLGFVVVRLLTVDVWKMELTGRIITFFLVGALLMSTAFLVRKKRNPSNDNTREEA